MNNYWAQTYYDVKNWWRICGETPRGAMTPFMVHAPFTLESLRQAIDEKLGFPFDQQRIVFDGVELTGDDTPLASLGIKDGSVVSLIHRSRDVARQ